MLVIIHLNKGAPSKSFTLVCDDGRDLCEKGYRAPQRHPRKLLHFAHVHGRMFQVVFVTKGFPFLQEVNAMPNIKSAIKRVKTIEKRRALNASQKSALRTAVKAADLLLSLLMWKLLKQL